MSYYKLTSTPLAPITLVDAKAFLRVDFTKDDDLITELIEAAVDYAERFLNADLRVKTWEAYYLKPSYSQYDQCLYLPLEKAPVQSVASVQVSTGDVFASFTSYIHRESGSFDKILLTQAVTIDSTAAYTFKVTFDSGYTTIPHLLKAAVEQHISFLYENRGDASEGLKIPNQITNIYQRYRNIAGYA